MKITQQPGTWATLVWMGTAIGWAIRCQVPPSHVRIGGGQSCNDCHQADFQKATQPLHEGVLSDNCAECHTDTSWAPARGDNHSFPLDGAHANVPCNSCHLGDPPVYTGTPSNCSACHAADLALVTDPPHADFPRDCGTCHGTSSWGGALFEHASFQLTGAHANAACSDCHSGNPPAFSGTPSDCKSCHGADLASVTSPPHDGFSSDCGSCHGTTAWTGADFVHSAFALTGAHATADCNSCHTGNPPTFAGTPTDCKSCHGADLASVTSPPHDGFSSDCGSCHGTTAWTGADFVHSAFALTGAHTSLDCSSCHTGNPPVFAGTPTDCVGCHQKDYDSSPYPGHSSFPTTCQDCHSTTGWTPASGGVHPQALFSITGRHNFPCNDCHDPSLGPDGAGNTNCVGCHTGAHTLSRMDGVHGEVGNYPRGANRAPNFCLTCHPGGTAGD